MFAIHSPTTVTLAEPGADGPFTRINFRVNGADTSRCIMEIVTPAGDIHRLTFNVRGVLNDQQFISHDDAPEDPEAQPLTAEDYMVDGRDLRAFDPYTHVPPRDAGSADRDAYPLAQRHGDVPEEAEKLSRQAHDDAARSAREAREELLARRDETPEERTDRLKDEREERRARVADALDKGGKADDGGVKVQTWPDDATRTEPMAPALSSPLPGSPPPHPLDRPDPGVVNTTQSMQARQPETDDRYHPSEPAPV